jgi:Domain of unknown function (DUF5076)
MEEEELAIELDPPEGVEEAESAVEVLRAWIGDGALLVSLNSSAFAEHIGDWGRLLAEIGHHVAKSAALNGYMQEDEAQAALRESFASSFEASASGMSGKLKGRTEH